MSLLSCQKLRVGYARRPLLPEVDLTVERGQFWAVLGRNGAGKTTLFRTLLGLQKPVSGRVQLAVQPAYLAQRLAFDPLYPVRVRELVETGTVHGWSFLRPLADPVDQALEATGITDLSECTFRSLSGGQKQRALFARMLATGSKLVFLDEPTVGMDAVAEREVMDLLARLRVEYELTVVVVTHYLDVARAHADNVLFLDKDDQNVVSGPLDQVFAHPAFRARYGQVL